MKGFATSPNPFMTGLRPKRFMAARIDMLRKEQMLKKLHRTAYMSKAAQTQPLK
jgi:hypothetical protein